MRFGGVRPVAVVGQWYPGDAEALIEAVKGYLHDAAAPRYRFEAFVFVERGLA